MAEQENELDPLQVAQGLAQAQTTPSRASGLALQLSEAIYSGALKVGERIPTEHQLKQAYGVSRTVIREAIAALRSEGLIVTRQGSGAFVARDRRRRPFRIDPDTFDNNDSIVQVMELRLCIEVEAAALAAINASGDSLKTIQECQHKLAREASEARPAIDEDFALHCAIADATGNPLISRFLRFLGPFIIPRPLVRMRPQDPEERRRYMRQMDAEHDLIVAAITAHNPAQARQFMRQHLQRGLELNRNAPQDRPA